MVEVTLPADKKSQTGKVDKTSKKSDTVHGPLPRGNTNRSGDNSVSDGAADQDWFGNNKDDIQIVKMSAFIAEMGFTLGWIGVTMQVYHHILHSSVPIFDSNLGEMTGIKLNGVEIGLTYLQIQIGTAVLLTCKFMLLWMVVTGINLPCKTRLLIWLVCQIIVVSVMVAMYGIYLSNFGYLTEMAFATFMIVILRCLTLGKTYRIWYSLEIDAYMKKKIRTGLCPPCPPCSRQPQRPLLMNNNNPAAPTTTNQLLETLEELVAVASSQQTDFVWERFRALLISVAAKLRSSLEREDEKSADDAYAAAAAAAAKVHNGAKPPKDG